jgi:hypothetical protein
MALSITSVTPNSGLTGGREFVLIQGTDFNTDVETDGSPKMEVYFDTEQATRVRVRSATELDCLTPIHDVGAVGVKVKDLDTSDEDTLANGFTYARPVIGGGTDSDIVRVCTVLIDEMKRQIIENVSLGTGIDFGGETWESINLLEIAEVPALILQGPRISDSAGSLHRTGEPWEETATDEFKKMRPQDIVNLEFILTGADDHDVRLLNLQREVISFFRRNPILKLLRDPSDPTRGYEEIDMRPPFPQDWRLESRGNRAGIRFFYGRFTLFGVPVGHDEWYDETRGITDFPDWQVTQLP